MSNVLEFRNLPTDYQDVSAVMDADLTVRVIGVPGTEGRMIPQEWSDED